MEREGGGSRRGGPGGGGASARQPAARRRSAAGARRRWRPEPLGLGGRGATSSGPALTCQSAGWGLLLRARRCPRARAGIRERGSQGRGGTGAEGEGRSEPSGHGVAVLGRCLSFSCGGSGGPLQRGWGTNPRRPRCVAPSWRWEQCVAQGGPDSDCLADKGVGGQVGSHAGRLATPGLRPRPNGAGVRSRVSGGCLVRVCRTDIR